MPTTLRQIQLSVPADAVLDAFPVPENREFVISVGGLLLAFEGPIAARNFAWEIKDKVNEYLMTRFTEGCDGSDMPPEAAA